MQETNRVTFPYMHGGVTGIRPFASQTMVLTLHFLSPTYYWAFKFYSLIPVNQELHIPPPEKAYTSEEIQALFDDFVRCFGDATASEFPFRIEGMMGKVAEVLDLKGHSGTNMVNSEVGS